MVGDDLAQVHLALLTKRSHCRGRARHTDAHGSEESQAGHEAEVGRRREGCKGGLQDPTEELIVGGRCKAYEAPRGDADEELQEHQRLRCIQAFRTRQPHGFEQRDYKFHQVVSD